MKKALKWVVIIVGGLLGVLLVAVIILSAGTSRRMNKAYQIQAQAVAIPSDAAAVQAGERLVSIYCTGCHGVDLSGSEFFNDPAIGVINAANLTTGRGGAGAVYTDADWVAAIRHGVAPDGRALMIMPSKDFYFLSDADLGQIIAYLKTMPPIDQSLEKPAVALPGRILMGLGAFGEVLSAESIPHDAPRPAAVQPGVDAAYGAYLVQTFGCRTCHGPDLTGGQDPAPGAPPAPNLTTSGNLITWAEQDFINVIRNRQSEWMPFEALRSMSDDELRAIWLYLQSLPEPEASAN
jgi:mono/diheme cytochrome c family protein